MSGRVKDCVACNGTGIDQTDPLGRCVFCAGTGEQDDEDDGHDDECWRDDEP